MPNLDRKKMKTITDISFFCIFAHVIINEYEKNSFFNDVPTEPPCSG